MPTSQSLFDGPVRAIGLNDKTEHQRVAVKLQRVAVKLQRFAVKLQRVNPPAVAPQIAWQQTAMTPAFSKAGL